MHPQTDLRLAWLATAIGAAAWITLFALNGMLDWASWLLLLGAFVFTPLALHLATGARRSLLLTPPAAALLAAAMIFDVPVPWLLAAPWLALTIGWGVLGLKRLLTLGLRRSQAAADWGLVLFAVSGAWTYASVMGWAVFGFPPIIVLLAGVHQLFAGLVLQSVAACIIGRVLAMPATLPRRAAPVLGFAVSIGNLLVASGILSSQYGGPVEYEFAVVCFYAGSVIMLGWLQLYAALARSSGLPWYARVPLVVSDLALGTAMTLAIIFAWGTQRGYPTLTIPEMITWHGTLNVFGFTLCALAGWMLASRRPSG